MSTKYFYPKTELVSEVNNGASLMVIMPFEPKVQGRAKLEAKLQNMIAAAENKLFESYPSRVANSLLKSLKDLVKLTDFSTRRKSIAYVLSSTVAKLYYLNIEVDENIRTGLFDVRDVVRSKSKDKKYLLLTVTGTTEKLLLGKNETLIPLVATRSKTNSSAYSVKPGADFLLDIDNGLDIILEAYPLPLLLACSEDLGIYLSERLDNYYRIAAFLPIDLDIESVNFSEQLVPVFLNNWSCIREADLLLRIDQGIAAGKAAFGITRVYNAIRQKKGKLLIVEKHYRHPAISDENPGSVSAHPSVFEKGILIPDLVDILIEQMIDNGGDVEFIEKKLPSRYEQIVLI
jgi:hypothetical protein